MSAWMPTAGPSPSGCTTRAQRSSTGVPCWTAWAALASPTTACTSTVVRTTSCFPHWHRLFAERTRSSQVEQPGQIPSQVLGMETERLQVILRRPHQLEAVVRTVGLQLRAGQPRSAADVRHQEVARFPAVVLADEQLTLH